MVFNTQADSHCSTQLALHPSHSFTCCLLATAALPDLENYFPYLHPLKR